MSYQQTKPAEQQEETVLNQNEVEKKIGKEQTRRKKSH